MKSPSNQRQQGAALLMMMLALIAISSALAYQFLGDMGQKLKRQNMESASQALLTAKQNLLIFAASQPDLYSSNNPIPGIGYMPPPDFDNEGQMGIVGANGISLDTWYNTRTDNIIGRMPAISKKTNGMFFFDRNCQGGQCDDDKDPLWLAVSGRSGTGNLRMQERVTPLNSNTLLTQLKLIKQTQNETIIIDGEAKVVEKTTFTKETDACSTTGIVCVDDFPVVAVIVAAGKPIQSQNRANKLDYKQYLDANNADDNRYNFVSRLPSNYSCSSKQSDACFNDRLVSIKAEDWIITMEQRVKSDANWKSLCEGTLISTHWLVVNQWKSVSGICP